MLANKNSIVEQLKSVDTSCVQTQFVSTFGCLQDKEVVATLMAWGGTSDIGVYNIKRFIEDDMGGKPWEFIKSIDESYGINISSQDKFRFISRHLSYYELSNVLKSLSRVYAHWDSLQNAVADVGQDEYLHEVLAMLFHGDTGFQSVYTNGSFYRVNLLLYWLCYETKIWQWDNKIMKHALLPWNDDLNTKAYLTGLFSRWKPCNENTARKATDKAREIFGDKDFYLLYQYLNYTKV